MEKKELIVWSDYFSVGYDVIDNQHKQLVGMINNLYDAFAEGNVNSIIEAILSEMIAYTDYHFQTEERYFEKYAYPLIEEHKREHHVFIEKVHLFFEDYKADSVTVTYEVMNFLKDWLLNHIIVSDKDFGKYFAKQRIITL